MTFWSGLKVFQDVLTDGETNFWLRQKKFFCDVSPTHATTAHLAVCTRATFLGMQ